MKGFIIKILVFSILFIIANYVYLEIIKKNDWNLSKAIEINSFKNKEFDLIVLGNSLVLDGVDCSFLTKKGTSSYNFALGGENLKSIYIQLIYYLKENKQPKAIFLGLSSMINSYSRNDESIHPIISYSYGLNHFSINNLPMIQFKWLAMENLKKIVSKNHRDAKIVLGQLQIKRKVPDVSIYKSNMRKSLSFDEYKGAKYLFKIDSLCKKDSIKLIIAEMPGYKKTQNNIPIGPNYIISDNDSITVYNLNNRVLCSELFNDKNDWLGNNHLNQFGALKLTTFIYENILAEF